MSEQHEVLAGVGYTEAFAGMAISLAVRCPVVLATRGFVSYVSSFAWFAAAREASCVERGDLGLTALDRVPFGPGDVKNVR